MKNHNQLLNNMCKEFQESGDLSGYRIFKLSQNGFEGVTNWEKLIAVFTFATKLLDRDTVNLIIQWLIHVLLMNNIWM